MKKNILKLTLVFTVIITLFMLTSCSTPESKAEKGWKRYIETYAETYGRTYEEMQSRMETGEYNITWVYVKDTDAVYYKSVHQKYGKLTIYFVYYAKGNYVTESNAQEAYEVATSVADASGFFVK